MYLSLYSVSSVPFGKFFRFTFCPSHHVWFTAKAGLAWNQGIDRVQKDFWRRWMIGVGWWWSFRPDSWDCALPNSVSLLSSSWSSKISSSTCQRCSPSERIFPWSLSNWTDSNQHLFASKRAVVWFVLQKQNLINKILVGTATIPFCIVLFKIYWIFWSRLSCPQSSMPFLLAKSLAGLVKLQVAQITPTPWCSVATSTPSNSLTVFTPIEDWVL